MGKRDSLQQDFSVSPAAGMPALRSEPEDSAPHGMRLQNLTGLTKKARDNEALRYRLEAGSLDTLGE